MWLCCFSAPKRRRASRIRTAKSLNAEKNIVNLVWQNILRYPNWPNLKNSKIPRRGDLIVHHAKTRALVALVRESEQKMPKKATDRQRVYKKKERERIIYSFY